MNLSTKIKLNNGVEIPILGLGTYQSEEGEQAYNVVRNGK